MLFLLLNNYARIIPYSRTPVPYLECKIVSKMFVMFAAVKTLLSSSGLIHLRLEFILIQFVGIFTLKFHRKILNIMSLKSFFKNFDFYFITWIMSFMSALSVDILAFFITETFGPTQVTITNLDLLDISSPV